MLLIVAVLLALALSSGDSLAVASPPQQVADSVWPMFGHDRQRTGRSPFTGPQTPEESWSFQASGDVFSSPAIGVEGTIYVGSWDNSLYAINPDGSQSWSFQTGGAIWSSAA
ncbi:MAG: PQQ-binding-like beta-propeller repeat protein, partial [SAR202 cluster bacterium]|nr:PQQ-binding-like beta-propeller repeat protein [SAR202 cluster bacterium]